MGFLICVSVSSASRTVLNTLAPNNGSQACAKGAAKKFPLKSDQRPARQETDKEVNPACMSNNATGAAQVRQRKERRRRSRSQRSAADANFLEELFTEGFLDVPHLPLDLPADFLGGSAIAHPRIIHGFPNLFLQLARRLLGITLNLVLCAGFHLRSPPCSNGSQFITSAHVE
jgi:hypothetical protein